MRGRARSKSSFPTGIAGEAGDWVDMGCGSQCQCRQKREGKFYHENQVREETVTGQLYRSLKLTGTHKPGI